MRGRLPLLTLLVAALAGCSSRDHTNIFDPANPVTRGHPIGFVALAGNGLVQLSWQPVNAEGLIGFDLLRRVEGETDYTPIGGFLPPTASHFSDYGAINGRDHYYRIYYVFSGGRGGAPAEDVATPGPLRVWLGDLDGRLLRVTPDGRHVATADAGYGSPGYVAANPRSGIVWISDAATGEVILYDPGTGSVTRFAGPTRPGAIGVDAARRVAWVCDDVQGVVHHLSETSGAIAPLLGPLEDPLDCAVDPTDGSVWVCDNHGDRVRRFAPDGSGLADLALSRPSRVAVDSLTREAWVTSLDQARAFRIGPDGVPRDTVVLSGPVGIAVDARRGRVWVADARSGTVVAMERDGAEAFHIGGLPNVTEIAVDLRTGDAWTTRPNDGELVRIAADGSRVSRLAGLGFPYGLSVTNPG